MYFINITVTAAQSNENTKELDNIIRRFPKLEKIVLDKEKEEIVTYLNEKVINRYKRSEL